MMFVLYGQVKMLRLHRTMKYVHFTEEESSWPCFNIDRHWIASAWSSAIYGINQREGQYTWMFWNYYTESVYTSPLIQHIDYLNIQLPAKRAYQMHVGNLAYSRLYKHCKPSLWSQFPNCFVLLSIFREFHTEKWSFMVHKTVLDYGLFCSNEFSLHNAKS